MLSSIKITDFRSYQGIYNIPVRRFNLLYGNNGSGKSSILDAIELAISTSLHRPSDHLANFRPGSNSYSIELIGLNNELLTRYSNGNSNMLLRELLVTFYGLPDNQDIDPNKAKSLLKSLFSNHNVITQEKIIRIIEDLSDKKLYDSVKELIVGRNLMDIQGKITDLSGAIDKLRDEFIGDNKSITNKVIEIEKEISVISTLGEKDLIVRANEILDNAGQAGLILMSNQMSINISNLNDWIVKLKNQLEEISNSIGVIKDNTDNKVIEFIRLQELLTSLISGLNYKRETIKINTEKLNENITVYGKLSHDFKFNIQELESIISNIDNDKIDLVLDINKWRSELRAYYTSIEIEKERDDINKQLQILNELYDKLLQIPASKAVIELKNSISSLKNKQESIKNELNDQYIISKEYLSEISKYEIQFKEWKSSLNNFQILYLIRITIL